MRLRGHPTGKKEYNEAQAKGTVLHGILSKIKQPEQLKKAVATTVTDDVELYTTAIQKIVEVFEKQHWFDAKWQQINERNLFYKTIVLFLRLQDLEENFCSNLQL